jgi:predicted nucleic acid-binding protein
VSWLVDTNILSELRKKQRCDPRVARWAVASAPESFHTSVLVLGEIRRGVERLRGRDVRQAKVLEAWLHQVRGAFAGRIHEVTEQVAEEWGKLSPIDALPAIDGLLLATARVHGLTLATRNTRDFARAGLKVVNPFES